MCFATVDRCRILGMHFAPFSLPSFAVANFAMAVVLKLPSHSFKRSHKFSSRLGEYYAESHNLSKAMVVQYGGQRPSNTANTTAAVVVVIRNPLSLLFCLQSKVFSEAFCTFDAPSFLDDGSAFKKRSPPSQHVSFGGAIHAV